MSRLIDSHGVLARKVAVLQSNTVKGTHTLCPNSSFCIIPWVITPLDPPQTSLLLIFITVSTNIHNRGASKSCYFPHNQTNGDLSSFLTGNCCRNQMLFLLRSAGVRGKKKRDSNVFSTVPAHD